MDSSHVNTDLAELGLLADDARRRLYDFVAGHGAPATREEAAKATGIGRTLAAYHLDRLAQAGLLDVSYARSNGRTGPGSGRPAKRYSRPQREVAVSLPPRNYSLLAEILATAAESAPSGEFMAALAHAAEHEGKNLGKEAESIPAALTTAGYEPVERDDGTIVLQNCPFHSVVQDHTDLVCTLNRAFIQGTLEGTDNDPDRAELSPCDGRCCVIIHADGHGSPPDAP
ncbi:ArsR family transcriptional regulator [Planctomonas sp. JC2975]|uniref:helix-turn-helix transcriptional regulator n=1 Tax=Planctomonas sp. JC2975 TaxID=2729626 RepID=UPI0014745CCC|nr:helix-turn-helix domain-containing protein [Planctomonas sp. JC2975]NNC11626.1 ArsR family transcriptional regulator [Planctomonas sp. JC2975]